MSVINNVLKDLETRKSGFAPIEIPALDGRADRKPAWKLAVLTSLGVLALAAAGWYYPQQAQRSPSIVDEADTDTAVAGAPSVAEVTTAVVEPEPAAVDAPARNQIIGLQMRESGDEMRLEFALRDKVVAYVTERGEGLFAYRLHDVENRIAEPLLRDNRWLRSLSLETAGDNVDIRFTTAADILVHTRQTRIDGEQIWSISFKPAAVGPAAEVVSAATPAETVEVTAPATEAAEPEAVDRAAQVRVDIRTTLPNASEINKLKYAVELINSGRHADAEKLLLGLLHGSEDYSARTRLLALYGRQKRTDRQSRLAQASLAKYPGDEVFLTEYARTLYRAKAYRAALELLGDIPSFNADQHSLAAASHQRLDHHERAIEHYLRALTLDAGNAKNWVGLGISQEHAAALEDALQSYRNAARLGQLNARLQAFVEQRSETLQQVID